MLAKVSPLVALALVSCTRAQPPAPAPAPVPAPAPAPAGEPARDASVDPGALVEQGMALRKGGPGADPAPNAKALALFEEACAADHPRGCEALAEMLQDHRYYAGTRADAEGAARAWNKACTLGNTHACYRLGFYLWEGMTDGVFVEKDGRVRKYRWPEDRGAGLERMRAACEAKVEEACKRVKEIVDQR